MAFFLEATFVGLFFFGWERLSRVGHMAWTARVALGSSLSALWILIANAWMQHPVGAQFNPQTMRMELLSFSQVLFNPVAQAKFVHTVAAGYVVGSVFVLAVSAWYLLRGRNVDIARRDRHRAPSDVDVPAAQQIPGAHRHHEYRPDDLVRRDGAYQLR